MRVILMAFIAGGVTGVGVTSLLRPPRSDVAFAPAVPITPPSADATIVKSAPALPLAVSSDRRATEPVAVHTAPRPVRARSRAVMKLSEDPETAPSLIMDGTD